MMTSAALQSISLNKSAVVVRVIYSSVCVKSEGVEKRNHNRSRRRRRRRPRYDTEHHTLSLSPSPSLQRRWILTRCSNVYLLFLFSFLTES
uniref:Uncharacterized protein n=1 Tax=Rhizophora mucronata TaxID=61149 RepID=A0A2P2LYC9_RHIMU